MGVAAISVVTAFELEIGNDDMSSVALLGAESDCSFWRKWRRKRGERRARMNLHIRKKIGMWRVSKSG